MAADRVPPKTSSMQTIVDHLSLAFAVSECLSISALTAGFTALASPEPPLDYLFSEYWLLLSALIVTAFQSSPVFVEIKAIFISDNFLCA